MTKKNYLKIILLLIFPFFFFGWYADAVEINTFDSDFSVEMIPNNPTPNETVLAKVVSYQFDVDRSNVTWTFNGQVIAKGVGKKDASFTAPDFGKESRLVVSIVTDKGVSTSKAINLAGNDIDFLWEARTTVPPWYKGKALPSFKSLVKVTAVPHLFSGGVEVAHSNLVYEWSLNYKNMPEASGFGKNSFIFRLNDYEKFAVGLRVSTKGKNASFEKYIDLSASDSKPKVVFYSDSPLEGVNHNNALVREVSLVEREITVRAEPYFFTDNASEIFSYEWMMNDKSIVPDTFPNILSLRAGDNSGSSILGLTVKRGFQIAEKFIKINF